MDNSNKIAAAKCIFLIGGIFIGITLGRRMSTLKVENDLSIAVTENQSLKAQVSEYESERIRIANAVLASESFHIIEPNVTKIQFNGFNGELLWFTGDTGVSYSQLIPKNDPGVSISDGKSVFKPQNATAFILKGTSLNGWKMTTEGSY